MNPHALLSTFLFSASAISCVTAAITASKAVDLAPTLLEHLAGLKDALVTIKNNRIISAAIQLRSLVPNYAIEVDFRHYEGESSSEGSSSSSSSDEVKPRPSAAPAAPVKSDKSSKRSDSESSSSSSDSDSDSDIDVLKSRDILISALTFVLQKIPSSSKRATLPQIASFDFAGPKSLDQFLEEKKSENAKKLTESSVIIRQIQRDLDLPPQSNPSVITTKILARIVAKLDALRRKYVEMLEIKKLSEFSKPSARKRAKRAILKPRSDIEDIVQKLAYSLRGL